MLRMWARASRSCVSSAGLSIEFKNNTNGGGQKCPPHTVLLGHCCFHAAICRLQTLRQHSGFSHHCHEIRVCHPARKSMHVDMPGHARSRSFAYIHPNIDPVGSVKLAQNMLHSLGQVHHLVSSFDRQFLQLIQMSERNDHHVPGGVGVTVENHVAMLSAVSDEGFRIISGPWKVAKDA